MCCSIFSHNNCTPPQTIFGKPDYHSEATWNDSASLSLTITFILIPLLNLRNLEMSTNHNCFVKLVTVSLLATAMVAGGLCIGPIEAIIRIAQGILTLPLLLFSCCSCEWAETLASVPMPLLISGGMNFIAPPILGTIRAFLSLTSSDNLML